MARRDKEACTRSLVVVVSWSGLEGMLMVVMGYRAVERRAHIWRTCLKIMGTGLGRGSEAVMADYVKMGGVGGVGISLLACCTKLWEM